MAFPSTADLADTGSQTLNHLVLRCWQSLLHQNQALCQGVLDVGPWCMMA